MINFKKQKDKELHNACFLKTQMKRKEICP